MNILFHYESLAIGGQQTQTLHLLEEMKRRGKYRLFFAYHYNDAMADKYKDCCSVIKIPAVLKTTDYKYKPWKILSLVFKLRTVIRENRIEAVISGSGLGSLICGLAARLAGVPHFRIIGCSLVQVEKTLYRHYKIFQLDRLIDGYFGWNAVFEELREKGVPGDKFFLTTNSVHTGIFYPLPDEEVNAVKRELGVPEGKLVIGWIGRISYDMQVKYTIEAARVLLEKGFTGFHLLIVGGGKWFESMKEKLNEYGLVNYATLTGWVDPSRVNRLINAMDIVPLLEEDPQGGSIVREAMACGKVALSVNGIAGTQASFMEPHCTVLVSPEDFIERAAEKIIELAGNPEQRAELGRNARKYAETHLGFHAQATVILDAVHKKARIRGRIAAMHPTGDSASVNL